MANYTVIALRARGQVRQIEKTFKGAPSEARIANVFNGRGEKWDLAVRYYPSRKGWMIIDLRGAFVRSGHKNTSLIYWSGIKRSSKAYPSESAAIMKALYILNPPSQIELKL